MVKYVKAADSIIKVVSPAGKEVEVTERAYNVVYKGQGYTLTSETNEREALKEKTNAELKVILDEKDIDYPSNATKDELISLIVGE
jgi:hypothetical protein